LSQKKTGGFVTGTNNAHYEWTDSNGLVKLGGYLTPSLGYGAVVWYDRRLCARWRQSLWQLSYNNGAWGTWTSIAGV
jgi:hypothetical protein